MALSPSSYSFIHCPLRSTLSSPLDLLLKSRWKPSWFHNSWIPHACKTSTCAAVRMSYVMDVEVSKYQDAWALWRSQGTNFLGSPCEYPSQSNVFWSFIFEILNLGRVGPPDSLHALKPLLLLSWSKILGFLMLILSATKLSCAPSLEHFLSGKNENF